MNMTDIELVIRISEKDYEYIKELGFSGYTDQTNRIVEAISNGIVIPKEHGDLIDRSKLLVELECGIRAGNYEEGYEKYPHINDMDDCYDTVKYADAVIKANY